MGLLSRSGHLYETFVLQHRNELFNFATKICRTHTVLPEDVLQDSLVKTWQAWPDWEPYHADAPEISAKAWAFRVVANTYADMRLKGIRRARSLEKAMLDPTSAWHDSTAYMANLAKEADDDRATVVSEAVSRLPQDQRAVIESHMSGRSLVQVANHLGMKQNSVKSRFQRGLKKLRPLLAYEAWTYYGIKDSAYATR